MQGLRNLRFTRILRPSSKVDHGSEGQGKSRREVCRLGKSRAHVREGLGRQGPHQQGRLHAAEVSRVGSQLLHWHPALPEVGLQ